MLHNFRNWLYLHFFSDIVGPREQSYTEIIDLRTQQLEQCKAYHRHKLREQQRLINHPRSTRNDDE